MQMALLISLATNNREESGAGSWKRKEVWEERFEDSRDLITFKCLLERYKKREKLKLWKRRECLWHKHVALQCSVQSGEVSESSENMGEMEAGLLTRETPCNVVPVKRDL